MLKYEENLWGKVDFLHDRYHNLYSNLHQYLEMITKFQTAFHTFSKSLSSISNKNYSIYSDKKLSLNPIIESIPKNISLHSKEFLEISEFIKSKVIDLTKISLNETFIKESNLYENYTKSKKIYNNNKINLEKSKNNYNDNVKSCENLILVAKTMKYNNTNSKKEIEKNENKANEGLSDAIYYQNRYIEYLNETNKNIEDINKKELDLLKLYEEIDKDIIIKIKGMTCMYIAGFKKMYSTLLADFTHLNNKFKTINSENDINLFVNKYKTNLNKEKSISFIPYEPQSTLNPKLINPTGEQEKDDLALDINLEVISSLKYYLKDVGKSINWEEEIKKKKLRHLISKIFVSNEDFTEIEKKELLNSIKDISNRIYFLTVLSKQRTKGRYKRSEKLINDLSDILNTILDFSEKENDLEEAKNCLILSQTFFCELIKSDNKKYKYYLFNNIKKNKWLHTIEFWENLIELMIQKEIEHNENSKIINKTEKQKINTLSNICFSQLLPYCQNMYEFGIPKKDIRAICQKFIDKYKIKKDFADTLINTINNCQNISFEDEIVDGKKEIKLNENKEVKEINSPKEEKNNNTNNKNFDKDNDINNINVINEKKIEEDKKEINEINININNDSKLTDNINEK